MINSVLAVILAGGEGSRLKPLTVKGGNAKPVVPYAGTTNTLSLAIGSLVGCGISKIDVYTQYNTESIDDRIREDWLPVLDHSVQLWTVPSTRTRSYKGTADAVYCNMDSIKKRNPSHVIITAADHACWIDYGHFLQLHASRNADMSIAVLPVLKQAAAKRLGVVEVDEKHLVKGFEEKPEDPKPMPKHPEKSLASMGIYCFEKDFLVELLERLHREGLNCHDFGKNIIPLVIREGARVMAYSHESYWEDLGSIKTYYEAQIQLLGSKPVFNPYINPFNPDICCKQIVLPPANILDATVANNVIISNGCMIDHCVIEGAILSPGVIVETGVNIKGAIIHSGARIGRGSHLERVIIGEEVIIPPNTIITPEKVDYPGVYHPGKSGITVIV